MCGKISPGSDLKFARLLGCFLRDHLELGEDLRDIKKSCLPCLMSSRMNAVLRDDGLVPVSGTDEDLQPFTGTIAALKVPHAPRVFGKSYGKFTSFTNTFVDFLERNQLHTEDVQGDGNCFLLYYPSTCALISLA